MIVRLPIAVYQAAVAVDAADALPDSDPAPLAQAIRAALDLDRDSPHYRGFLDMIAAACESLRALRLETGGVAAVMSSSYRFDDACGDEFWLTVSMGRYRFSNGCYFGSAPPPDHPHYEQGNSARAILDALVAEGWAGRLCTLSRLPSLQKWGAREIGLLIREDGDFLMIGDSVEGGRGIFWSIDPESGFGVAGVQPENDGEIDELMDAERPIEIITIEAFAAEILPAFETLPHWPEDRSSPAPAPGSRTAPHAAEVLRLLRGNDVDAARRKLVREAGMTEAAADNWIATVQEEISREQELEETFEYLTRLE